MRKIILLILFVLLIPIGAIADLFYPDLILNYSDFSYITSIAVGYRYVYFGTTNGITRYDISKSQWAEPMMVNEGPGSGVIHEIRVSFDDENVWARTDIGIFEYSNLTDRWTEVDEMPNTQTHGQHLKAGDVYYAPWGYDFLPGGVLADQHDRRFPLTDIVDDGWGNLWIGTWGLGAAHSDNASRRIDLLPYGLLQKDITCLYRDGDVLWMGGMAENSYRTGLTRFNTKNNSFDYVESYGGLIYNADNVYDITANDRDLFAATGDGVWVVSRKDKKTSDQLKRSSGLPDNNVAALFASGDTLFVGTEYGVGEIYLFTDSVKRISPTMLPSHTVLCLEKAGNDLWIGTNSGVYRLDLETGMLGFLSSDKLSHAGSVYDIKYIDGKIWLASDYELASIDISTAEIKLYPEVNNYGGANAVAANDTLIAAATMQGLLLISQGKHPYSQLFTTSDGLLSDNIRDLIFDENYLWLGTDSGLVRFWYKDPDL
jgi:ligand-binding sensor domain-containing protein